MSHVSKQTTTIRNPKAIVRALERMGYKVGKRVEVHEEAVKCHGYHEEETYKANIVLRRHLGNGYSNRSSDVGWELQKDGSYAYHGDNFEYSDVECFDDAWQQKFETYAAIEAAKIELEERDIEYEEKQDENHNPILEARFRLEDEDRFRA
jgi:hypothetical protein